MSNAIAPSFSAAGNCFGTVTARPTFSFAEARRTLLPGYIQLGIAREILPTLRGLGIEPDALIREAGLDPRLFDDSLNVIPHSALGRLLSLGAARTTCTHFGLLVGQRATILSLGLVGRLMLQSETVGDAVRSLVANLSVQDRSAVPSLAIDDGMALFTIFIGQPEVESAHQISDASLALAVNALRALCGPDWNPCEVLLPRALPADTGIYRRHFRAPVRFDHERPVIVFSACDLQKRISGADPVMRALLEERLQQMRCSQGSEFVEDIRRLLRIRLTTTRCSADEVAELFAIHRRTLSRRLKCDGVAYRAVANEIRFEIAQQLLKDTDVPLGQISAALGYSEASAFTRAFRRWSGRTPTSWRAEGRSEMHSPAQTVN